MSEASTFSKTLYGIGSFLLLFLFSLFALGTIGLSLGFQIPCSSFYFGVFSASIILYFIQKKEQRTVAWVLFITALSWIIVFLCLILASLYFDCSFDGQWYHQDAILFFDRGWNPFYEPLVEDVKASGFNARYVNHYPKASWTVSAILFKLTHNIEIGKAIHFIAFFAFVCMTFPFIRRTCTINWWQTSLVVLMLAFSPVIAGQCFSYCVDGFLASLLFLFVVLLIQLVSYPSEKKYWVLAGACFVLLINLKFTSLVYAALFILGFLVFVLIRKPSLLKSYVFGWTLLTFVGVCCFGYPTYVRNYLEKGHPFYPLMGKNNEGKSISEVSYAGNFFEMNRFEKFYASHAAIPIYTDQTHNAIQKPLFNLYHSKKDWGYYKSLQPLAMSPLGPYGAELWLYFLVLVILFFWKNKNPWSIGLFFLIATTMVVQPEFWNFRYAPQLMLLFGLVCAELFSRKSSIVRGFTLLFALLFLFNESIVMYQSWKWVQEKNELLEKNLQSLSNKEVKMQSGWMHSFELKLEAYHIKPNYQLEPSDSLVKFAGDNYPNWQFVIPQQE